MPIGCVMKNVAKFDIAEEQLFDSLNLFIAGHYYSASTLAGAAEEIFSKILNSRGEKSQLDEINQFENMIRSNVGQSARKKSSTGKMLYGLRNSLKHIDLRKRGDFVLIFKLNPDAKVQMLRAIFSYEKLKKGRSIPDYMGDAIFEFRRKLRHNK